MPHPYLHCEAADAEDQRTSLASAEPGPSPEDAVPNPSQKRRFPFRAVLAACAVGCVVCGAVALARRAGKGSVAPADAATEDVAAKYTQAIEVSGYGSANAPPHIQVVNDVDTSLLPLPAWHKMHLHVPLDEGDQIETVAVSFDRECQHKCDRHDRCHSFVVCGNMCYMKTKALTGFEEKKKNWFCSTYFKSRLKYIPADHSLMEPSVGQSMTLYMYRVVQGDKGERKLENSNTASVEGALWYLHNEVIPVCDGSGWMADGSKMGDRKWGINRMYRYKVTVKATTPLMKTGNYWGALKSFDSGEDTGPHRGYEAFGEGTGFLSTNEWEQFGYTVGCGQIGKWPHKDWDYLAGYGPKAIWYSLPGACPEMRYDSMSQTCVDESVGGWCEGSATGQGNCTYSYEPRGWIDLDELVGIKPKWASRKEFCQECGSEGSFMEGGGCGLSFWDKNIWDELGNVRRVEATKAAFRKKYPDWENEVDVIEPVCNFNPESYGFKTD